MGADVQGRRRRGRGKRAPMSQINVTPFVDVMLVLLVIFMITAPLLTAGVEVNLPEAGAKPLKGSDEPLSVAIDKAGKLYIQESEVVLEELGPKLQAITERKPDARIFVRGDRDIAYGQIMAVMSAINQAGFNNVALVTVIPKEEGASKGGASK
ncbi:MAG: protein TolR [Alphaproteobacteria bacterium]|nr:protein TolR [Alphaproteobacteria bacterium]